MKLQSFAFENEIYFENQIILEFHPPTEFARDTVLYIVVRSLSSEQNVIKPIKFCKDANGSRADLEYKTKLGSKKNWLGPWSF